MIDNDTLSSIDPMTDCRYEIPGNRPEGTPLIPDRSKGCGIVTQKKLNMVNIHECECTYSYCRLLRNTLEIGKHFRR